MVEIGRKIQEARKRNHLSVEQLSEKTKIRPYIIEAIEAGNFKILPPVYIKSFIKTIAQFLKIHDIEINEIDNTKSNKKELEIEKKETNIEKNDIIKESNKKEINQILPNETINSIKNNVENKKIILDNTKITGNFTEIFKKNNIKKSSNTYFFNYVIYSILSFAVIAAVYFTFITVNSEEISTTQSNSSNKNNDTTEIKEKSDNLLSYFEKPDSLTLIAKAHDTAWMRINIDGTSNKEVLMKPGMEEEWKAKEFFLIDQGNVGAIKFIRNGETLQPFGSAGSVIKNVKITVDQVTNANVWKLDTAKSNTNAAINNERPARRKVKKEEPKRRIILEESNVQSPSIFKQNETKPPN